jgi:hypothetical protein
MTRPVSVISRGALSDPYPGDIIPERRAKSSWSAERHQIGLSGDITPDSLATSPGICIKNRRMPEKVEHRLAEIIRFAC